MSDTSNSASGGVGFAGSLTVLFVGLKLTHFIDWRWLWVLSPIWIPIFTVLGGMLIFLTVAGICYSIAGILEAIEKRQRRAKRKAAK